MVIDQIVSLSVVYLLVESVALANRPPFLGSFGVKAKDYRFIVGIGTDDHNDTAIRCLGSVINETVIITLASCFDKDKEEEQDDEDSDYVDERRRKRLVVRQTEGTSRRRSTNMKRYKRNGVQPPKPFSLFRIDKKLKAFVRLAVDGVRLVKDPDYKSLSRIRLWKEDLAIMITSNPLNFTEVRPIAPIPMNFGEYIKSLHQVMVNTMSCQVIGLVRDTDEDIFYSPMDRNVELKAHDVILLYEKCNNTVCFTEKEDCADTGHHIYNNPDHPLPSFIGGSPLVCEGKLLSVVNVDSHCDEVKYSAEFPQPETVRGLLKPFVLPDSGRKTSDGIAVPKIPRPTWATDASYTFLLNWFATCGTLILNLVIN